MVGKLFMAVGLSGSKVIVEASSDLKVIFDEYSDMADDNNLNLPKYLEPGLYQIDVDAVPIGNDDDWDIKVLEVSPLPVEALRTETGKKGTWRAVQTPRQAGRRSRKSR